MLPGKFYFFFEILDSTCAHKWFSNSPRSSLRQFCSWPPRGKIITMDHSHYLHVNVHVSWESARDTLTAKWNGNGFRSPGKTILVAIESIIGNAEAFPILCVRYIRWEREREREIQREKDGSDVTIVALKLAMSFALLLAKNVHLSIGDEFCAFPCQKICTSVSPSTLSVAKNVALFETVRILRTAKWRDPSTLLSPSLHSPQHLTPATLFLDSSIPLCSFISLSYSFLVH